MSICILLYILSAIFLCVLKARDEGELWHQDQAPAEREGVHHAEQYYLLRAAAAGRGRPGKGAAGATGHGVHG